MSTEARLVGLAVDLSERTVVAAEVAEAAFGRAPADVGSLTKGDVEWVIDQAAHLFAEGATGRCELDEGALEALDAEPQRRAKQHIVDAVYALLKL